MNIEDLKYLQETFEFIRTNTELIDHNRDIETYSNNMMNCENIISRELSERQLSTEVSENNDRKALHIADVRERFSNDYKTKLFHKYMKYYGDDKISREKANAFALGFSKAWDIILSDL